MKATKRLFFYAFILMGGILITMSSCKKDEDENDQPDTVRDIDGNVYKTVKIGNLEWMAENLRTTKYHNGSSIPNVTDNEAWAGLSTPAYCWYNNDRATYGNTYGALYNWYAVETGNLCPTGWRVPTDAEWTTLTDHAGGESVAGGKLKSTRTEPDAHPRWDSPNTDATNEYDFSALPGGYRYDSNGAFNYVGSFSPLWSSSGFDATNAWRRNIRYDFGEVFRGSNNKRYGFSVRCVRDL